MCFPVHKILDVAANVADALVSPMAKSRRRCLDSAAAGQEDYAGRKDRLSKKQCKRRDKCATANVAYFRPEVPSRAFHAPLRCGNLACESCRRDWVVKQLLRAFQRLLFASLGTDAGRDTVLYVGRVERRSWKRFSMRLYRLSWSAGYDEKPSGYGRVFLPDGGALVVAEFFFPGSRALLPGNAFKLIADAIEQAPNRKHAVRWCSDWREPQKDRSGWGHCRYKRSLAEVQQMALSLGGTVRPTASQQSAFRVYFPPTVDRQEMQSFWYWLSGCPMDARSLYSVPTTPLEWSKTARHPGGPQPEWGKPPEHGCGVSAA